MVVHYASRIVSPAVPQAPLVQAFLTIGTHLCGEAQEGATAVANLTDSVSVSRSYAAVRVNIRLIPFENIRTARVSQDGVHMGALPFVDRTLGLLWRTLMMV
ncbi:hypothetical protein [Streptomyces sp. NBC_00233]|uniref:hypothetical protein n=1 Tax=Streptomyces sp. NBC_00233 TaxID=2975686 RepID=UPI00224F0DD8|nr:hypothetical protein [Streptomyces sp. NBC_00233]MCX5230825.1 hypothetical protein [Streptomyces sp. NBC_00233]